MVAPRFGVENGHESYIVEMGIVGKSAKKTVSFCYFAQSCPTNTFRDIATTFCLIY